MTVCLLSLKPREALAAPVPPFAWQPPIVVSGCADGFVVWLDAAQGCSSEPSLSSGRVCSCHIESEIQTQ